MELEFNRDRAKTSCSRLSHTTGPTLAPQFETYYLQSLLSLWHARLQIKRYHCNCCQLSQELCCQISRLRC